MAFCIRHYFARPLMGFVDAGIIYFALVFWCSIGATAAAQDARDNSDIKNPVSAITSATDSPDQTSKVGKSEASDAASTRSMRVTVIDDQNKPVAKANVRACIWTEKPFTLKKNYVCDENGQAIVELPEKIDILRLWARSEGLVPMFAAWAKREIPQEFTVQLPKGTTIGGIVKNDDGQGIQGVNVWVKVTSPREEARFDQVPIPVNMFDVTSDAGLMTDERGVWKLDIAPEGDEYEFKVLLNHPDYVSDCAWGESQDLQSVDSRLFRGRTGTICMHGGFTVSGVVHDASGKVVPDAIVIWGDDPYLELGSREVRTGANGRYKLPPLPAGRLNVTVVAKDWAPDQKSVVIDEMTKSVDFELQRGALIRLLFVDQVGNAIPEVGVKIERWRDGKALYNQEHANVLSTKIPFLSDRNGVYEWAWAPRDGVKFRFDKEGYRSILNVELQANDQLEHCVTLSK